MAQHKIGVRAGYNYASISGPLEVGEELNVNRGFHFGINYTYHFTPDFGIRGELMYTQRGTTQRFQDTTGVFQIIKPISLGSSPFVAEGKKDLTIEITNAYFSIPITANYRIANKFEFFGGISIDFMIGSSGRGNVDFESIGRDPFIGYIQSYDFNYNSDRAGQFNDFVTDFVTITVDGESVLLPKIVGAYYDYTPVADFDLPNKFNKLDAHLIGGLNYFINSGFYLGARLEYGLRDITLEEMDNSLRELNADGSFVTRDDFDRSVSISASFGFRF